MICFDCLNKIQKINRNLNTIDKQIIYSIHNVTKIRRNIEIIPIMVGKPQFIFLSNEFLAGFRC